MSETVVCSFLLRFIQNQEEDDANPWFGAVRHVQTSTERRFTDMNDAVDFINGFLLLQSEEPDQPEVDEEREPPP